jgi:hypothetical protein
MGSVREIPLDEKTLELIKSINQEAAKAQQDAMMAAVMPFANQIDGIKRMVVMQSGLPGEWVLSPDMTKMIRVDRQQDEYPQPEDFTKRTQVRKK